MYTIKINNKARNIVDLRFVKKIVERWKSCSQLDSSVPLSFWKSAVLNFCNFLFRYIKKSFLDLHVLHSDYTMMAIRLSHLTGTFIVLHEKSLTLQLQLPRGTFNYFAHVPHKFYAEAGLMTLNSIKRTSIRIFRELNAHIHDGSSHWRVLKALNLCTQLKKRACRAF